MGLKDIARTIGEHAPLLGSLLGGKAGGMVGSLVASALGVSEDKITEASLTPENILKLKELEFTHKAELERMQIDLAKAEIADVANAREQHKHSPMPTIITLVMTLMATMYGLGLFYVEMPATNKDMINYFGGQLITLWVGSIVYWIGTTRSSAEKDRRLK